MIADSGWDLAWCERPVEEARNFNPAFCCELIARTVSEYCKKRETALNFAMAFLILPLVVHRPTREALPGRANAALASWVTENNPLIAELPRRIARLRPITREALLFAVSHKVLSIQGGGLFPGKFPIRLNARPVATTDDVNEARAAAALLGRWFASQGTQTSIMQGMGVMP